jgi:hypothetical protein
LSQNICKAFAARQADSGVRSPRRQCANTEVIIHCRSYDEYLCSIRKSYNKPAVEISCLLHIVASRYVMDIHTSAYGKYGKYCIHSHCTTSFGVCTHARCCLDPSCASTWQTANVQSDNSSSETFRVIAIVIMVALVRSSSSRRRELCRLVIVVVSCRRQKRIVDVISKIDTDYGVPWTSLPFNDVRG